MTTSGRPTTELLYVAPASDEHRIDAELDDAVTSPSVAVADGVVDAEDRLGGAIDCVVAHYDLADGTGLEVLDSVREADPTVPVVLLVEVRDGDNLATAVSSDADECVPVEDGVPIDQVADAVEKYVAGDDGPLIADPYPTDTRSVYEWKANIFDQLFSRFPIHLFVKDSRGRHVLLNEGLTEDPENALGKSDVEIGFVAPENAQRAYEDDLRVIRTGEPIVEQEEHYPSVGNWDLTSKIPWYDTNGEIAGLLGVSQDITERKEREHQLEIINHLLRHTIRNDVTVVRGYAELLRDEVDDDVDLPDRILRTVDDLVATADKHQDIVNTLTGTESAEPTDAVEVVRRAVETVADRYPNARIDCELPNALTVSAIDEIERAIQELVENAIRHSERDRPEVRVRAERRDDSVEIRVADDGPPIPEMEVGALTGEHELEPLFHASGLGLSLVNWIVTRSDGTLDFESADGDGNLVTVTLPIAD